MLSLQPLKFGLLGLWAGWFTLVALTNVFDALKAARLLPRQWRFASDNYRRVRDAVAVYDATASLAGWLYAGVIGWQIVAAALLWRALVSSAAAGALLVGAVNLAFTVALAMWAAFLLSEEIFQQYRTEGKHLLFFIAQLLTLGALHLLPN